MPIRADPRPSANSPAKERGTDSVKRILFFKGTKKVQNNDINLFSYPGEKGERVNLTNPARAKKVAAGLAPG